MKSEFGVLFAMAMLGAAVTAEEVVKEPANKQGADTKTIARFYYAKVTDRNGEDEYRVLTQEELNTMETEIAAENRCYARALIATEAEWKKSEDLKKKTFPRSAVKPKKVAVLQSFNDRATADKKLQTYGEREADRAEREKTRNKGGGSQRSKDQQASDVRREADRMALEDRARSIFEGKLAEMIAGAKKPAEGAAPVAPAPPK